MQNSLTVTFSDNTLPGKGNINITPHSVDNSTTLILHGKGSNDYGASLWSNMVHLMEHFCSDIEPREPTEGQIWYDHYDKSLKVYSRNRLNELGWYKLYIDNPDSNSPKITPTALAKKMLEGYVSRYGDTMLAPLYLPPTVFKTDGSLFDTTAETKDQAASLDYVDARLKQSLGSQTNITSSDPNLQQYFVTVGDFFILHGFISKNDTVLTPLTTTSGEVYGTKFTADIKFPASLTVQLDPNQQPDYQVTACCELTHNSSDYNEYLSNELREYKTSVINKTNLGCSLVSNVGLLFDNGRLRESDVSTPDVNSEVSIKCFKYTIIGRI